MDVKHQLSQQRVNRAVSWMAIVVAIGLIAFVICCKHITDGTHFWVN